MGVDLQTASVKQPAPPPLPGTAFGAPPPAAPTVELYIHDVGGHDAFRDAAPKFLEGVQGCVIVYDAGSQASFEGAARW